MSADESHDENDPFAAHFHREPLPEAGVRVIQITELPEDAAQAVVAPLDLWFRSSGRAIEIRVIRVDRAMARLGEASRPRWMEHRCLSFSSRRLSSPGPRASGTFAQIDRRLRPRRGPATRGAGSCGGSPACRAGLCSRFRSLMSTLLASFIEPRS